MSASSLTQSRESRWQQRARRTMANQCAGKASSDIPALKPYRGKPAVRNFRGGNGNVGIIRSPVRALALPDRANKPAKPFNFWALTLEYQGSNRLTGFFTLCTDVDSVQLSPSLVGEACGEQPGHVHRSSNAVTGS